MNIERDRLCERIKDNLKATQKNLRHSQDQFNESDTAVRIAEGKLSTAQSDLGRILKTLDAIKSSTPGCIAGSGVSCLRAIYKLLQERADQEGQITRLSDDLRLKKTQRDGFQRDVEHWRRTQERVIADQRANGCI